MQAYIAYELYRQRVAEFEREAELRRRLPKRESGRLRGFALTHLRLRRRAPLVARASAGAPVPLTATMKGMAPLTATDKADHGPWLGRRGTASRGTAGGGGGGDVRSRGAEARLRAVGDQPADCRARAPRGPAALRPSGRIASGTADPCRRVVARARGVDHDPPLGSADRSRVARRRGRGRDHPDRRLPERRRRDPAADPAGARCRAR